MIKIERKSDNGTFWYRFEGDRNVLQLEAFHNRRFFKLLQDIKVLHSYPYIIEKTRTLELEYRCNPISDSLYVVNTGGWRVVAPRFTLKELWKLYETALLLIKYEHPAFLEAEGKISE